MSKKEDLENENEFLENALHGLTDSGHFGELKETERDKPVDEEDEDFSITNLDYEKERSKATTLAKRTMNSLLKFYVSEKFISQNDYIKAKVNIDQMTISNLIYQLKVNEKAIDTLMKTIDAGQLSYRYFEMLSSLQSTNLDIVKAQTTFMIAAEEHMKKLHYDYDVYTKDRNINADDAEIVEFDSKEGNENKILYRGTRGLLKNLDDDDDESGES